MHRQFCLEARKDFLWQKQRELQDSQRQWLEEEIEVLSAAVAVNGGMCCTSSFGGICGLMIYVYKREQMVMLP